MYPDVLKALGEQFDEAYYLDGLRSRKSMYENFRWMPEIAFSRASVIRRLYPGASILDLGCSFGYIVYALRLMGVDAYGYDISEYAIWNCKEEIREFVFCDREQVPAVDVVFGKDILEHIPYGVLPAELKWIASVCKEACFVVPFGEDKKYRILEYALDTTHVICENEEWWTINFVEAGFIIRDFSHYVPGIKDNWINRHPYGNGVFFLEKME